MALERWLIILLVLFHLAETRGKAGSSLPAPLERPWQGLGRDGWMSPVLSWWQCCSQSRGGPEPQREKKEEAGVWQCFLTSKGQELRLARNHVAA